jgi:hypothetical protein
MFPQKYLNVVVSYILLRYAIVTTLIIYINGKIRFLSYASHLDNQIKIITKHCYQGKEYSILKKLIKFVNKTCFFYNFQGLKILCCILKGIIKPNILTFLSYLLFLIKKLSQIFILRVRNTSVVAYLMIKTFSGGL